MSQIIAEEVAAYLEPLLAPVITAGTNTIEQWFNANVYLPLQKFFTDSLFQFTGQLQTFVGNILTGGATGSPPSWIDIPSLIIYILNGNAPQFSGIYNTAIKALTDYFANNTNLITSITTVIGTSINSIFSTTGTAANAFFTQLSTSLLDAVSKIGPDILDTYASLTTVFNSLTTVITTDLTSIMGTSVDILQYMKFDLTNLISTSLATVVQAITLIPDNAFITITNDVLPLLTTVEKELSGFINVTGASLQFAAFQITNSLSELETFVVEEFKAKVGDEGEYIINTLEAFMGPLVGIGATLALTQSSTMQLVSGVGQSIIDRVDNCCIETQNGFVNMNQALQQGLGNIWAQFDIQEKLPMIAATASFFAGLGVFLAGDPQLVTTTWKTVVGTLDKWFGGLVNNIINTLIVQNPPSATSLILNPTAEISRILTGALGLGASIALPLMAGELVSPLKQLGMSQLSAYVFEAADFKNIGGSVLGALMESSSVAPLRKSLNFTYRNSLIPLGQADTAFFRDGITQETLTNTYRLNGWPDEYITSWQSVFHEVPNQRMIINMLETPGIDEDWLRKMLKWNGMSEIDVENVLIYGFRKKLEPVLARAVTQWIDDFVAGYMNAEKLTSSLFLLGYSDIHIKWLVFAAQLQYDRQRQKEVVAIVLEQFHNDFIDQTLMQSEIQGLVPDVQVAQNIIDHALFLHKVKVTVTKAAKKKLLSVTELLNAYDAYLLDLTNVLARFEALGYNVYDAYIILNTHITKNGGLALVPPPP